MIDIPLPRLLDSNGATDRVIQPISESINLEITPLSYATMVLPVGETLPARAFVELFTNIGSVGIYRVRSPQDAYGEETTTAELEHAIVEVGDWLVRADITGSMAIQTAMTQVFSHYRGGKWQLGSITALGTDTITVSVEYERVLDAMLTILAMKPECYLDFDFSTTPWTVSVKQRDTTVTAEGRLSRNINSANVSYDDTDLCTRAYYPVDVMDSTTGEVTRTWYYVDADTINTYGVAERSVYNSDNTTAAQALATAQEYLNLYKRPKFGVQISGEELSSITGESLDRFAIGKLFRLSLTDYNTTIDQTITSLSWDDVYNAPTSVTVTLADEEAGTFDMVTALHNIDKNGGTVSGGRSSSGQQYKSEMVGGQYRTKFDQTDRYIDLVAQKTNTSGDILEQAGLYLDSQGVLVYADDFENNLGSKLNVQADKIGMVVGTYQGSNYIKAGEITLAINQSTGQSEAKIDANHVYIGNDKSTTVIAGKAELTDLNAATARITSIEADYLTATNISSKMSGSGLTIGGQFICNSLTVGNQAIGNANITSLVSATQLTDGSVKFTGYRPSGASYDIGTFSRAAGSVTSLAADNDSVSYGNNYNTLYVPVTAKGTNISDFTRSVTVDSSGARSAGYTAGRTYEAGLYTHYGQQELFGLNTATGQMYSVGNHNWYYK